MVFKGSRYEKTPVRQVLLPHGQLVTALGIRFIPSTPAGFLHTFKSNERLDLLAYQFYRNPEKFWLIADANEEMSPEDLMQPGRKLRIPPDRV